MASLAARSPSAVVGKWTYAQHRGSCRVYQEMVDSTKFITKSKVGEGKRGEKGAQSFSGSAQKTHNEGHLRRMWSHHLPFTTDERRGYTAIYRRTRLRSMWTAMYR